MSKKIKILLSVTAIFSLLAFVFTAAAFNPDNEPNSISSDQLAKEFGPVPVNKLKGKISIGAVEKNMANQFWQSLGNGYKNMAKKYKIKVDIQAARTETDLQAQLSILETMMIKKYNAFLLSPLSNDNLTTAVKELKRKKIPVVNVNCEYISEADVFVGSLQKDIGVLAADYIGNKLGNKGKVAVIEGVPGAYTSIQRVSGFKEIIAKKYPGIKIVSSVPANYERQKGMDVAMDVLNQHPDLDAFFAANDNMALGAVEAVRNRDKKKVGKLIIIGVDGTDGAYDSIKKGELTGTVDQFPEKNGEIGMEVALRLLAGQKLPRVISTPEALVDKDNIAQYRK
jgi:ribose transport system substrate-binding protein